MSTAYHLQTDGQTKKLNQILEQYLQYYVNYTQNNWLKLLPVTQFIYNATPQKGIKMSLFKANYRYDSVTSFTLKQAKKLNKIAKKKS